MAWLYIIIASAGEIAGVMAINLYIQKKSVLWLGAMVASFGTGFIFLRMAMQEIQMGTAYAVWTGLGAAGAVIMGIFIFREPANWKRLLFLCCIIAGAAGLKILS